MPVDGRFVLRPYAGGDEEAILDLFARSFPHAPRSRAHFEWKYGHSPFGNHHIALAFDEARRLVGHYAGYPVPFRRGTHSLIAHQVGDTMTDPAVRQVGRGATSVLGRTAMEFYRRFCEGQVAFNYGFNVANIQKFSLRFLRSERVEPVMFRVLSSDALPPLSSRMRRALGYALELVGRVGWEFDEFFARASSGYGMLVRRDAAYLRWRYLECPDRTYAVVAIRKWGHLVGWVVYRVEGETMMLGDLLIHREAPEALEIALAHLVPLHRVRSVRGWLPPRPSWLAARLEAAGFIRQQEPQDLSLMVVPFALPDAAAVMRSSLFYTWGDSDLF